MGRIVISIDAELAWGFHDQETMPVDRVQQARHGWRETLTLLDEFSVPATWAVVGHLCLDGCDGTHATHSVPQDWFDRDPGATATDAPSWYAPTLVDAIRGADVNHEIGCHSFSHVLFEEETTTATTARAELAASLTAASQMDLCPTSFVFPRNRVGHRDLLAEYGFTSYRGRKPSEFGDNRRLLLPWKALRSLRGATPPLVEPWVDEWGLVNIPASLYLFEFETHLAAALPEHPIVRRARAGVDAAAASDGVFHLWFHPNNLRSDAHVDRLREVLSYIATRRDEGAVTVETMDEIARETRDTVRERAWQ